MWGGSFLVYISQEPGSTDQFASRIHEAQLALQTTAITPARWEGDGWMDGWTGGSGCDSAIETSIRC